MAPRKKQKSRGVRIAQVGVIVVIVVLTMYFVTIRPDTDLEISTVDSTVDRTPAFAFNLSEYLGDWNEIGRTPVRFEEGCVCVQAQYRAVGDDVSVLNRCDRGGGLIEEIQGVARTTDTPGVLEVQFFPLFSSDYRVLWVNDDYNTALVNSKDTLWLLGREGISDESVDAALQNAEDRGFDLSTFSYTEVCQW